MSLLPWCDEVAQAFRMRTLRCETLAERETFIERFQVVCQYLKFRPLRHRIRV